MTLDAAGRESPAPVLPLDAAKTVVGQRVWLGIRPEHIVVGAPSGSAQSLTATIERIEQLGGASFLYCSLVGGETLTVHASGQVAHAVGAQINVHLPLVDVHVFEVRKASCARPLEPSTMQAVRTATFAGRLANSVRFDLEADWRCEVFVLADDLIRVLFRTRTRSGSHALDRRARQRRRSVGGSRSARRHRIGCPALRSPRMSTKLH